MTWRKRRMNEQQDVGFDMWAVLELMGHRRIGAKVTEQTIAGAGFLRVDVYGLDGDNPVLTQFYPPAAVYCITPTTERLARRMGEHVQPAPVSRYELPAPESTEDCDD